MRDLLASCAATGGAHVQKPTVSTSTNKETMIARGGVAHVSDAATKTSL